MSVESSEHEIKQQPITHATEDRQGKLCGCIVCGSEAICTPSWDFYSEEKGGPLKCEACMPANLKAIGLDLKGIFFLLKPGMKVRVTQGLMKGEDGVVKATGRFKTLVEGGLSPHSVLVDFPGKSKPGKMFTLGKLAGDLEILS